MTLHELENLKGRLATKLLLPEFVFILEKASKGCLEVTFSIPPSLVEQLQTEVKNTPLREFVEMEIESITVDGVVCYEAPLLQYTTLLKQLYTSRSPLQPLSDSKPNTLLPFRLARIEKQTLSSSSDMDRFTRESLRGDMDDVIHKKTAMELSELGVMGDSSRPQVVLMEGAPGVGRGQAAAGLLHCATASPQRQQHQTNLLPPWPLPTQQRTSERGSEQKSCREWRERMSDLAGGLGRVN